MKSRAYFDRQSSLIDGVAEGIKHPQKLAQLLGGLGRAKLEQVAQERAADSKCGLVTCASSIERESFGHQQISVLSNGEVVHASEVVQFCTEECLRVARELVDKRPNGDDWDMELACIAQAKAEHESTCRVQPSLVTQVKEKSTKHGKSKVKRAFPEPAKLDIRVEPEVQRKLFEKTVTFQDTAWDDDAPPTDDVEASPNLDPDDGEEEGEDVADSPGLDQEDDLVDDVEDLLASLLDLSLVPQGPIEESGMSCFIVVMDFIMRIINDRTRALIQPVNENGTLPHPNVDLDNDEIADRLSRLEREVRVGVGVCNFGASSEFEASAMSQLSRLLPSMDLSRDLPQLSVNQWALFVCVLLGALAETGRFNGFDFENDDITFCFTSTELSQIDASKLRALKDTVLLGSDMDGTIQ